MEGSTIMLLDISRYNFSAYKKEFAALVALALPMLLSQVAQVGTGFVDTVMAGSISTSDLSAVGLGNSVFFTVYITLLGVMTALNPMISQAFGVHKHKNTNDTQKAIGNLGWQGIWYGLFLGVIGLFLVWSVIGFFDKFLNLDVLDNFIIAFTLSPEEIALKNEKYTASFKNRVKAIKELQNKGWKVRICIDPLIYTDDFEKNYSEMIEYLFSEIDKNKVIDVSIGVFRTSKEYLKKMRNQNKKSEILYYPFECIDGVYTYSDKLKSYMIDFIKEKFLKYIDNERIY